MLDRRQFLLLSAFGLSACQAGFARSYGQSVSLQPGSTLIIVRHADRDGEALSLVGHRRARALVPALADVRIDAIYSRDIARNLETAAPLAADRGLPVGLIEAENPARDLARLGAGRSVLWVGNRTNIEPLWEALGTEGDPPVDYGDLFIVRASDGLQVERRRFEP